MDPTSIKGVDPPGPHESGAVSGLELSGTVIEIEYENGTVQTVNSFSDGSPGGGQATVTDNASPAPTIGVANVSLESTTLSPEHTAATVSETDQTITITGPAGATVRLLRAEAGLFLDGVPDGGYDLEAYEANSVVQVEEYTATIGSDGSVEVPVTLTDSVTANESGLNYFIAAIEDSNGDTGETSNVVVLNHSSGAPTLDPIGDVSIQEGDTKTVGVSASDPDGDPINLSASNLPGFATFTDNGDGTGELTFAPQEGDAGTYELTVTASDGELTDSQNVTVSVLENGTVLHRVNAGGSSLTAVDDGPDWDVDTDSNPSPYHNSGSETSDFSDEPITVDGSVPSSTPPEVFDTARWDPSSGEEMQWEFPVESGTEVEVRLYFADPYDGTSQPGDRVFDVVIDGETVLDNYDIVADVGPDTGTMKSFTVTSDGTVDIDFLHVSNNPIISGVEIVQPAASPNELGGTSSVDFGTVTVGDTSTETVRLENLGESGDPDITITDTSITGANDAEFSDDFDGNVTLAPGESTTVNVTFAPSSDGAKEAALEVSHTGNNSPYTVNLSGTGGNGSQATVSFGSSDLDLSGAGIENPTSLEFGPDGRLYVSEVSGTIYALTVERNGENNYTVTDTEVITAIEDIPNHQDDGSLAPDVTGRQVTGITVTGTAQQPVIYVSSSDPRIGGKSSGEDTGLDTNSGVISKLTWNGTAWNHVQLVRGLPRSEENHAPNGLVLDESTNTLYLAQGGNTGQGAPSNELAYLSEYAYAAAILSIDLDQIESMSTKTGPDSGIPYKYDLPTLKDTSTPWGGEDGLNQAKLTTDGPVQIYSPGYRNAYDLTLTEDGQMYTVDNGGSKGWGAPPVNEGPDGACTNEPNDGGENQIDQLHLVTENFYGGHPNPVRSNPDGAGIYDENGNLLLDFNESYTPVPFSMAEDRQCDMLWPGEEDGALTTFSDSTNGITEYTASNFDGAMQGDLLTVSLTTEGQVWRIGLNETGESVVSKDTLASNFGSHSLDVTTRGDDESFPGTVWVANYGSSSITVLEPGDYNGTSTDECTGADDPALDEDGDGYDNADELDAGSDPCSAADTPPDNDGDLTSDVNDPDDDNDGIPDTDDPFAIDAANGLDTTIPVEYDFETGSVEGTFFDVGFTGLMTNGTDYLELYNKSQVTASGIAGVLSIDDPTGDPTTNDQTYAFQFGVDTPDAPFTVHTEIQNSFVDDPSTDDFQSTGIYLGPGDQDNYVKLVANSDDGDVSMVMAKEENGTYETVASQSIGNASDLGSTFDLYLRVDPGNDSVIAEYSLDGGDTVVTLGETSIDGSWLADTEQGLGIGVIATHEGTSYQATWEFIDVVLSENQPPALETIPNQTVQADETKTVPVNATDPNGDPIDLSASDLPSFASFTDNGDGTGNLTLSPQQGDVGTYELTVTASDGNLTDSQTVTVTVTENASVLYRVNAGGSSLAALDDGPDWDVDTSSNPSPYHNAGSETSDYSDQTIAIDGSVPSSTPPEVFDTARWDPESGEEMQWEFPVESGTEVEVRLYFVDAFDGTSEPGDRVFDVVIENETVLDDYDIVADVGPDTGTMKSFTVTSDGTVDIDFLHVVENPIVSAVEIRMGNATAGTNQPPELETIPDQSVEENQTTTVAVNASDPDGDAINLTASNLPSFASFTDNGDGTGELTLSPQEGDAGAYELTITASDGNLTDSQNVTVNVTDDEANQAPELEPIADQTVEENQTTTVAVNASDPDGDPINLTASNLPAFATFADNGDGTGELTLAPEDGDAGTYELTVTASDGNLTDSQNVTVNVTDDETNQPPTLETIPNQTIDAGETRTVPVNASDPDGDAINLTASNLPSFASFTDNGDGTGELTLAPEEGDAGTYELTVTASDGNLTDSQTVAVTVAENTSVLYRVNAGGSSLTALDDGPDWDVDTKGSPSPYHNSGSKTSDYSGKSITVDGSVPSSTPPEVFDTARWDPKSGEEMQWEFPVEAGTNVTVRLYFVDAWDGTTEPGDRVFDVAIEGETVLDDYDIVADVGNDTGTMKSFTVTSDGTVDVDFLHVVQNPIVSAVEIVRTDNTTANVAPELDPIEEQSVAVNETESVTVNASDPNGDSLNLTASNLPSFASFTDNGDGTGELTFAPQDGDVGTYELTVTASDGELTDSQNVTVIVTENTSVLYRVNAGGSSLAALDDGPDWDVDTESSPSPYHNSGSETSDYSDQSIAVNDSVPPSTPPEVFDTTRWDPSSGEEMQWEFPVESGTEVEVRLYFVDAFDGTSQPGDRVFDVVIENETVLDDYDIVADVGPDTGTMKSFTVTSDGTVDVDFLHVVENPIVAAVEIRTDDATASTNQPPALETIPDQSVEENQTTTVAVNASDPDGDPIDLSASNLPSFATFTDNGDGTGELTLSPQEGDAGTYELTVTASDGEATDSQNVTVNVTDDEANQAPELEPIADQTVEENQTTTVAVNASDPDGDSINLTASNLPSFASFTDNGDGTGELTLSPEEGDAGAYELNVTASDGNLTDSQTVAVNVTANETNSAPELGTIPDQTVEENQTKAVAVNASDPDGDPIDLSASDLPSFASFTDNGDGTGELTLAPQEGDAGTYELTVTASDGNLTDSQNVTVNVTADETNSPPELGTIPDQTVEENQTTTVAVNASDPDGDPIDLTASNLPAFATFADNGDGTGELTLSPEDGDAGTYELTVTASDGNLTDSQNVTVTVTDDENTSVLYRVNAGGSSLAAIDDSSDWDVDTESNPSPYHNSGSETSSYDKTLAVDGTVPASTPPEVFDTARWDPSSGEEMQWEFPVENGTEVEVRLYFVDAWDGTSEPGDRVFDVVIENETVLDNYDIVADVGNDTGTMKSFTVTSDGTVDIDFLHVVQNPIVSAVEIVEKNSSSS